MVYISEEKKKRILNVFLIYFIYSFILYLFFFTTYDLPHQLNLYVVYWISLKIVQISQNAIWSNDTYAIVARLVLVVSPGVCLRGGGGGGGGCRCLAALLAL